MAFPKLDSKQEFRDFVRSKLPSFLLALLGGGAVLACLGFVMGYAWEDIHPALNAWLNFTSGMLLFTGLRAIKNKEPSKHKDLMLAAFLCSSVFLVSYLLRFAMSGTHRFQGDGLLKTIYLAILFSHMILAMVSLPMIFGSILYAWKGMYSKHKRLAKWTWAIWFYVSVTGVVVYWMLYRL